MSSVLSGRSKSSRPLPSRMDPAGHRRRNERAQEVQAGMYPHQAMPAVPVDAGGDPGAGEGGIGRCFRNVDDLVRGRALAGIDDADGGPIVEDQLATVARLTASERVEDGAVEANPGFIHRGDAGFARPCVRILPEHFLGHRYRSVSMPMRLTPNWSRSGRGPREPVRRRLRFGSSASMRRVYVPGRKRRRERQRGGSTRPFQRRVAGLPSMFS